MKKYEIKIKVMFQFYAYVFFRDENIKIYFF